ncbi:hypothetical protein R1flu_016548 [Riccia fluitans]|uniref:Uncharacterized protein n=1 Tax=Riccia fluitans TaxID=41844 RepID=A0ABD1YM58_9MARC
MHQQEEEKAQIEQSDEFDPTRRGRKSEAPNAAECLDPAEVDAAVDTETWTNWSIAGADTETWTEWSLAPADLSIPSNESLILFF